MYLDIEDRFLHILSCVSCESGRREIRQKAILNLVTYPIHYHELYDLFFGPKKKKKKGNVRRIIGTIYNYWVPGRGYHIHDTSYPLYDNDDDEVLLHFLAAARWHLHISVADTSNK